MPRVLYRTRAPCFPSPRERAYLKARMAFDAAHPDGPAELGLITAINGSKNVEVPEVDRVLLCGSDDEALEVDFEAPCEVVPQ